MVLCLIIFSHCNDSHLIHYTDSRCEVSTISLDNEALYIHRIIGVFELPKNNLQLGLLGPAISPLKFARVSEGTTTYRFDVIIIDQPI
jgi:hypothetical protein